MRVRFSMRSSRGCCADDEGACSDSDCMPLSFVGKWSHQMARYTVPGSDILEPWNGCLAHFHRKWTARMEAAARRRIVQRWRTPRNADPFGTIVDLRQ